jgi:hypothetical protein
MDRLTFFVSLHGVSSAGVWKSVRGKYEEELAILSGRKGLERKGCVSRRCVSFQTDETTKNPVRPTPSNQHGCLTCLN